MRQGKGIIRSVATAVMAVAMMFPTVLKAQNGTADELVFGEQTTLSRKDKGKLTFDVDNLHFFKNNEYSGGRTDGMTLPGFTLRPSFGFQPLKNVKIEAGVNMRYYWGMKGIPMTHFTDITGDEAEPDGKRRRIAATPFLRAHVDVCPGLSFVFGSIYGGANHNLPAPLYDYQHTFDENAETGLQILAKTKHFDMDMWINWENFIFKGDYWQEAFTFGVATETKVNSPKSKFHVSFPINAVFQHRGGEINTKPDNRVQTWANLSAGVNMQLNFDSNIFRNIRAEGLVAYMMQQKGNLLPYDNGFLYYGKGAMQIWRFNIGGAFWMSKDFISLKGNPYYSAVHIPIDNTTFVNPKAGCLNIEYCQSFNSYISMAFKGDIYLTGKCRAMADNKTWEEKMGTGFAAGLYLRLSPSFLIKKFRFGMR